MPPSQSADCDLNHSKLQLPRVVAAAFYASEESVHNGLYQPVPDLISA